MKNVDLSIALKRVCMELDPSSALVTESYGESFFLEYKFVFVSTLF